MIISLIIVSCILVIAIIINMWREKEKIFGWLNHRDDDKTGKKKYYKDKIIKNFNEGWEIKLTFEEIKAIYQKLYKEWRVREDELVVMGYFQIWNRSYEQSVLSRKYIKINMKRNYLSHDDYDKYIEWLENEIEERKEKKVREETEKIFNDIFKGTE
jgi:hypothetical protein